MQEKYNKQKKHLLLVRRQHRSCILQRGYWKNIYDSIDVKINTLEQMQSFKIVKYVLPGHKSVICICNVTQNIFHVGYFVKVAAYFSPKINRPLVEGFVVDINGIGNT